MTNLEIIEFQQNEIDTLIDLVNKMMTISEQDCKTIKCLKLEIDVLRDRQFVKNDN